MNTPWMLTHTGVAFPLLHPDPEHVTLEDIAHHLSRINRFTGATRGHPYSVAQHSVMVAMCVPEEYAREALFHDAHEAYMGDLSTPLKLALQTVGSNHGLLQLRDIIDDAICDRFDLGDLDAPSISHADLRLLATERRDLMPAHPAPWPVLDGIDPLPGRIVPMHHDTARRAFLDMAHDLGIR